jgi:hypothetical protein
MSNALAIAAVTTTLRNLLTQRAREELESGTVTTLPPDKARVSGDSASQINIFLYQTLPNAAWRNQDITNRVKPGETGQPPLALTLYYLITAYGNNNDDIKAHRLLGTAMQVLHDQAALPTTDIKNALAESDLHNQVERVRISPVSLSLEELSKLWSSFQTQYRLSAAYEVSVVLIESKRPVKTPLPVIARGDKDEGFPVAGNLIPPLPTLEEVKLPNRQPSVRLGESLTLRGHHLISSEKLDAIVRLTHPRLPQPHELNPQITDSELEVQLPKETQDLQAGFYTVTVSFKEKSIIKETNALSFSLAPEIEKIEPKVIPASGDRTLTITCTPPVWPEQQVSLLVGDREFLPQFESGKRTFTDKTNELKFNLQGISPGEYYLRLRVDGVDSLLVDYLKQPPVFGDKKVRVQ